jgi:hypothetical protein
MAKRKSIYIEGFGHKNPIPPAGSATSAPQASSTGSTSQPESRRKASSGSAP